MLKGPFKEVFWVGQLLLGTLVPLALLLLPTRKQPWAVVAACALIVVGIFGLRLNIVIPALSVEEVHGMAAAVSTPRITEAYFPSLSEWLLTIGISGLGMLLLGLGERWLPRSHVQDVLRTRRRNWSPAFSQEPARRDGGWRRGRVPDRLRQLRLQGTLAASERRRAEGAGREAGEWIASCCNMCRRQSGILCHVVNGVVEKIEPNHWNPNNYSNISSDFFAGYTEENSCAEGGAICPKGNAGIMQLYDPDRERRPLKCTNPDRSPGAARNGRRSVGSRR